MKFKCVICGKIGGGRLPRGGDGTFYYPCRHKDSSGKLCKGVFCEAEWVAPNKGTQPDRIGGRLSERWEE